MRELDSLHYFLKEIVYYGNTKIEKKDVVVGILDIIDSAAFGALVGKAVVCFMPKALRLL